MSQQPPPQPQQAPYGHSQWEQPTPFPYNRAPIGNSPQPHQPLQGQYPSSQTQWGQQVPSPPQQPFPWTVPYPEQFQPSSSPSMSPQRKQRDLRPWYKRQGRGGRIGLVCGLL